MCIKSTTPSETRYIPKLNIINPETTVKFCLGKLFDIHCPIRTPRRLVVIKAKAAPVKIIIGLPDCAESINVASWVLSPNSARKIVLKEVINILMKVSESFESLDFILDFELS